MLQKAYNSRLLIHNCREIKNLNFLNLKSGKNQIISKCVQTFYITIIVRLHENNKNMEKKLVCIFH